MHSEIEEYCTKPEEQHVPRADEYVLKTLWIKAVCSLGLQEKWRTLKVKKRHMSQKKLVKVK